MYQVGMVISDAHVAKCVGAFAHRDCSISMETGDLIEDDGPYVCRKGNELPWLTLDYVVFSGTREIHQTQINGLVWLFPISILPDVRETLPTETVASAWRPET